MLSSTSSNVSVEQARMRDVPVRPSACGSWTTTTCCTKSSRTRSKIGTSTSVSDGRSGGRQAPQYQYSDCIFLDLVLPNYLVSNWPRSFGGLEEARYLSPPAYLIGATGNMEGREEKVCLASGMNDFIAKLFSPELIQETFRKFLRSRGISQSDSIATPLLLNEIAKRFRLGFRRTKSVRILGQLSDLNRQPTHYKCVALPIELSWQKYPPWDSNPEPTD